MRALLISLQRNLNIIGLRSIHHFLIDRGHESRFIYLNRFDENNLPMMESFRAFVEEQSPGVIGVSLMSLDYLPAKAVTAALKAWFPHIPVIWGGIHPTVAPEMCLDHADYLCLGEGEHVMLDIADALENNRPLKNIANLCYRENGGMRTNPIRALEQNLDVFPILTQIPPDSFIQHDVAVEPLAMRHLERFKLFRGRFYRTMVARGCPMHCSYCVNSFMKKLYVEGDWALRRRSVEHVMRELEQAVKDVPKTHYISFGDDCLPGASMDYLKDFFAQYKARIGLPFLAKSTSPFVTPERMDMAVDAGMSHLVVGLQSGSERVCRDVYRRPLLPQDFLRAARLISQYPMAASYDIIVDNPFETHEEGIETIEIIASIPKPFFLNVFSLTFYRGTGLREQIEREYPDKLDDPERKGYPVPSNSSVNKLKRIAATLHAPLMRALLARYKRRPDGWVTQAFITLAKLYCHYILEPLSYFMLLRLSQRRSTLRAVRALFDMVDFRSLAGVIFSKRMKDTADDAA